MRLFTTILYRLLLVFMMLIYASCFTILLAQKNTTTLAELEIIASPIKKNGIGEKNIQIDSSILKNYTHSNLASLLINQTSIYLKEYGVGMLSTISFRGTGAAHTTILWNGMHVGYPFLGQTDLSLIPVDFIGDINLIHGSSSSRYGTGSIGGTIDLKTKKPKKGFQLSLNQSFGSFGNTNSMVQISNYGQNSYIKIAGIYKKNKNNFPYKSTTGNPLGLQEHANYLSAGIHFESMYRINPNNSLSLSVQGISTDRNLQPSIGSKAKDIQIDANIWSSFIYRHHLNSGIFKVQYGYLYDKIKYNKSTTESKQHNVVTTFNYDFTSIFSTEIGLNTNWTSVYTPFYKNNKNSENKYNIYTSIFLKVLAKLDANFSLRYSFVNHYTVPLIPSIGLEYEAVNTNIWQLIFLGKLAKGYKLPTMNDRFWRPGGNKNLIPEESKSVEVGIKIKNKASTWLHCTAYKLWVKHWILWLPSEGLVWSPVNKKRVNGVGLEVETGFKKKLEKIQLSSWINYSFTKSTNKEALDQFDRSVGKQLPYVPFHNGSIVGEILINNKWELQLNGIVVGKRFTTSDNENLVEGYFLLNAQILYKINLNSWLLEAYVNLNNLTNTNYQSLINKAMPGISFLSGIKINFNKL